MSLGCRLLARPGNPRLRIGDDPAFPINDPRYIVLVMVDEPKPNAHSYGFATGGWVAAPVVSRIVQRMAPLLGMAPVPKDAPETKNDLLLTVSATANAPE